MVPVWFGLLNQEPYTDPYVRFCERAESRLIPDPRGSPYSIVVATHSSPALADRHTVAQRRVPTFRGFAFSA